MSSLQQPRLQACGPLLRVAPHLSHPISCHLSRHSINKAMKRLWFNLGHGRLSKA